MKFKVDENLPAELAADHQADTVPEQGLTGTDDATILARVQSEGRTILTMDKGMGNIRAYPPDQYAGIIFFRLQTTARGAVLAFVRQQLPRLLQMDLNGRLVIVTEAGIRIR